jgi:hypothetical protein
MTSYTLYHHPYSICSIMVRYTLALRGSPKDPSSQINVTEKVVDIFHEAQLEEDFLLNINAKGQVRTFPLPHPPSPSTTPQLTPSPPTRSPS